MAALETEPSMVDSVALDEPPRLSESQLTEIERMVNELSPDELANMPVEKLGHALDQIEKEPVDESVVVEEVDREQVFTKEEQEAVETTENKVEKVEKSRNWLKTGLKTLGLFALIGVTGYAGYLAVTAGAQLWTAMEAGPVLAKLAVKAVEVAANGYETVAKAVGGSAESAKDIAKTVGEMGTLSDANAEVASNAAKQIERAAELARDAGSAISGPTSGNIPNPFGPEIPPIQP